MTFLTVAGLLLVGARLGARGRGFTALKVRLETRDLEATVRFYADILGIEVVDRWAEGSDVGVVFALTRADGSAFLEFGEVPEPREAGVTVQLRTANLDAFAARVGDRWPVDGPHERPWGSVYAYLRDPNGVELIVYQDEGRAGR